MRAICFRAEVFQRARAQTSLPQNGKGHKIARVLKVTLPPPPPHHQSTQACDPHTATLCSSQKQCALVRACTRAKCSVALRFQLAQTDYQLKKEIGGAHSARRCNCMRALSATLFKEDGCDRQKRDNRSIRLRQPTPSDIAATRIR